MFVFGLWYNKLMPEVSQNSSNILVKYLIWHFFDVPKAILKAWRNFLQFNLNYFSIFFLLKTLFSPWRRHQWSSGRGFDMKIWLETRLSNLISRLIGAAVRIFLILIGTLVEILMFFGGIALLVCWLALPILLLSGLGLGLKMLIY